MRRSAKTEAGASRSPVLSRLAVVWALLACAAVLLLRDRPDRALYALVWLSAVAFPALWIASTPVREGWGRRLEELAGGVLVVAPLIALLLPWSPVAPEVLRACVLGVLTAWVAVGLWLGAARGTPGVRLAWALALCAGVPLAQRVLGDALGWERRPWCSAADALRASWGGSLAPADWALVCAPWVAFAGAAWLWGRRAPRLAVAGLAALAVSVAAGDEADARLVLGGWSRAGEPTPVWVQADPKASGLPGVKVAGVRALHAPQAGAFPLAGPPAPSELVRLEVGRETSAGWEGSTLPEALRAVPMGALLIGTLGGSPPPGRVPEGPQVALQARDVQLLAVAGQSLDLLWISPGVLRESWVPPLAAWAACGGTLVVSDPADAARFGLASGGGARASGAGWLVFAPPGAPVSHVAEAALGARLTARARRRATLETLLGRAAPAPPPAATRWIVWGALTWATVVLGVAGWLGSLRALAVASLLALIGTGWGGARYVGPRVLSAQVLEACAGSDVARRLELLTVFAPRPSDVRLRLDGGAPWPIHDRAVDAWRTPLSVTQGPAGAEVRCHASPVGTHLARLDAVRLGGAISVTRGSAGNRLKLVNRSTLDLERVFVLFRGAAYEVGELGAARQVEFDLQQQAGLRFDRWRLRSLRPREASLVRAVVHGRELDRQLVVVGWTRGSAPSESPDAAWVVQDPTLVLVRAVGP